MSELAENRAVEATPHRPPPTVLIEPSRGWVALELRRVWEYRELLSFLIWRDLKVRYKQTTLGALWAIIQPVCTMIVFSIFFGHLAKIPSDGVPYPVFSYTALLPWTFFAQALAQATSSLVGNANLISKVYFPRLIVPISTVCAALVDFAIAFAVLGVLMVVYGILPTWAVITLPAFLLLALVTALGVGLWLAALNVEYRDVRYIVPFLTQFWLFATPVAYPASMVGEPWRTLYALNPMVGVVEGFRWALLGTATAPGLVGLVSAAAALVLLISGAFYFRRVEKSFADMV